jgi:hypothetical protein
MQALRYWDYYGMTESFTKLYEESKSGGTFENLYSLITSRENILLAFRNLKTNKGSKTVGTDGKDIGDHPTNLNWSVGLIFVFIT